ncbi:MULTISPECIES: hypothetical protein [Pseudomonas]|nr:hypothetical protein [Pseudomonas baetica]
MRFVSGQTYAVGIYSDIGACTIGQVWKDPSNCSPCLQQLLE